MRRAPIGWKPLLPADRIIPADAGSTPECRPNASTRPDHPRRCGEHMFCSCIMVPVPGSSPQMRGALIADGFPGRQFGIIPADAGSTCAILSSLCIPWDHPRRCGEHSVMRVTSKGVTGSSPQMRGALRAVRHEPDDDGIIPADAGSTTGSARGQRAAWDHPRRCGEHSESCTTRSQSGGSSPQMRGARGGFLHTRRIPGIIPADAGSTMKSLSDRPTAQDHPRRCGEHAPMARMITVNGGSSPQMRGARFQMSSTPYIDRIIPADAGSTFGRAKDKSDSEDHPRRSGEHTDKMCV